MRGPGLLFVAVAFVACTGDRSVTASASLPETPEAAAPVSVPAMPSWIERLNLPVPPGATSPLGVPVPRGFKSRGKLKGAYRYSGEVPLKTTLDFYRRILDTLFIEERQPGQWYFDKADLRVGRLESRVLVVVRRGAGRATDIFLAKAAEPEPRTASRGPMTLQEKVEDRSRRTKFHELTKRLGQKRVKLTPEEKADPAYY